MIEFSGRILCQIQLDSPFVHSHWGTTRNVNPARQSSAPRDRIQIRFSAVGFALMDTPFPFPLRLVVFSRSRDAVSLDTQETAVRCT